MQSARLHSEGWTESIGLSVEAFRAVTGPGKTIMGDFIRSLYLKWGGKRFSDEQSLLVYYGISDTFVKGSGNHHAYR